MLTIEPAPTLVRVEAHHVPSLCLGDIHSTWERERHTSARQSRDQAIQKAHQATYRLSHSQSRSVSKHTRTPSQARDTDLLSLPAMSRPNTGRPWTGLTWLEGEPNRAHSDLTLDQSNQQRPTSSRVSSRMCRRAQSAAVAMDPRESVSCLSRQCCEVLGPRSCSPCDKMERQERGLVDFQPDHPNLHISEENFSTTACVKHRLPNLSTYQIQHKVIHGEIARPMFKDQAVRIKSAASYEDSVRGKFNKWKRRSLSKNSFPYFTSIQDLNRKLTSGDAPTSILPPQKRPAGTGPTETQEKPKESFSEMLMPTFISSKQTKIVKPKYTAFYAPPLLPKVCQNVEPSFFVGNTNSPGQAGSNPGH